MVDYDKLAGAMVDALNKPNWRLADRVVDEVKAADLHPHGATSQIRQLHRMLAFLEAQRIATQAELDQQLAELPKPVWSD